MKTEQIVCMFKLISDLLRHMNKPKDLKVAKEDQRSIVTMVDMLNG